MAGDNRLFQEHLKRGASYAWNGQWERAVHEFSCALEESPDDVAAKTQLAMALYKSGRLQEALALYRQMWDAQPSNLSLLQKLAEVQEALGDRDEALASYQLLAEVYIRRQTPKNALKVWLKAVKLSPLNLALWDSLVETAIKVGALAEVMPLYLNLARDLALFNRFEDAIQVVEKAQELDPQNGSVPEMLASIRRALEHTLRAEAAGEEITPEELADIIPTIAVAEPPIDQRSASSQPESTLSKPTLRVSLEHPSTIPISPPPQPPVARHDQGVLPEEELQRGDNHPQQEGRIDDSDLLQPGTGIAEQLEEIAETYESLEQEDEAMDANRQLVEISKELSHALLGSARTHLSHGELDLAEDNARQLLQQGDGHIEDVVVPTIKMLLDVVEERAAQGNLGAAAETLYRLQNAGAALDIPADVMKMIAARSVEFIGRAANEHLEEIVLLEPEARAEVITALRRIETLLEGGKLRSSADEAYGLITLYPDFLPAQLMLASVLVAQGRLKDAEEKAHHLVKLYEMRGATHQAQKVASWIAQVGIEGGNTDDQLVELQKEELPEEPQAAPDGEQSSGAAEGIGDTPPTWDNMLDQAEIGIASGRRDTAVGQVKAALDMDEARDPAARAALLRILQVMEPNETQRCELAELLQRYGLPQQLAD
ncbi:MAG: tetratricopeptide repeat protein [Chloroflexota bacterium]